MRSSRPLLAVSAVLLVVAGLAAALPLLWAIATSFKTQLDAQGYPPTFIPLHPTTSNYAIVAGDSSFWSAAGTSVVVTVFTGVLVLVIAVPCAYALIRTSFLGKPVLVVGLLAVQTLPGIVLVVPMYSIATAVGLYDTRTLLVLVYSAFLLPLATWIIAAFIRAVPSEVEEAARVDGASQLQILWRVVTPMIAPGLATAAIFVSLGAWNEFLTPVMLGESNARPLTVYIASFVTQKTIEWGPLCAALCLVLAPPLVVVIVLQRQLIRGLTTGSVKA